MRYLLSIFWVFIALICVSFSTTSDKSWGTDFDKAKQQALAENKVILLSFSGSDWCGNCMRLEKVLFESSEFAAFAKDHLVLLNADFPMKKKNILSAEQTKHNEGLADKYNPKGVFPMVKVLSADGRVMGELSTPKETASEYIRALKSIIE